MTKQNVYTLCFIWSLSLLINLPLSVWAGKVPTEIAGIALGSRVDSYPHITESNFMKEVVVKNWHGFRKGNISYGVCEYKGEILKIDMKYEDKSEKFYKTLFKMFRQKFGPADLWSGDSFGILHIWKWHFVDDRQNRVSLSLQFNKKNSNETIGNMVRLSYPDKIAKERLCFNQMSDQNETQQDGTTQEDQQETDWSYLIPQ